MSKDQKDRFIHHVKQWVVVDSQLASVNETARKLRATKHELTDAICEYMVEQKIDHNKIKITDGELKVYEKNEYSPLTFTFVKECLDEILDKPEHSDQIIEYMKEKREVKTSRDIRRYTRTEAK
jgi:hypothetical protein